MTPINSVPPEILSHIFFHCLPCPKDDLTDPVHLFPPPPTPSECPLLVARVSSLWRAVAVSTPLLWASPVVEYRYTPRPTNPLYKATRMALPLFELFLQRSAAYPLTAKLVFNERNDKRYLSALLRHIHHWNHISIDAADVLTDDDVALALKEHQLRWRLPSSGLTLKSLQLKLDLSLGNANQHYVEWSSSILSNATSLRKLHCFSEISLPLSGAISPHLTHIHIEGIGIPAKDALMLLANGRALEQFSSGLITDPAVSGVGPFIFNTAPFTTQPEDTQQIIVPKLTHLRIKCCTVPSFIDHFYSALSLPALTNLVFEFQGHVWPHHEILALLDRSQGCAITSLSLKCISITDVQLLDILRHPAVHNTLTELKIWECTAAVTDDVVHALSVAKPSSILSEEGSSSTTMTVPSCFLPSLRTIIFHHCMVQSAGTLGRAIHSRVAHADHQGLRVFLTWFWPFEREDNALLGDLMKKGLVKDMVVRP